MIKPKRQRIGGKRLVTITRVGIFNPEPRKSKMGPIVSVNRDNLSIGLSREIRGMFINHSRGLLWI
jgi:hypothetical protein